MPEFYKAMKNEKFYLGYCIFKAFIKNCFDLNYHLRKKKKKKKGCTCTTLADPLVTHPSLHYSGISILEWYLYIRS